MPIRAYLRNRVLRIVPAYWTILIVACLVLGAASVRGISGDLGVGRLSDLRSFVQAALLVQDYHPRTVVIGIGPAWSLAVEAVFYLLLPLLVLTAARAARPVERRNRRVLILLAPPLLLLLIGLSGKHVAGHVFPGLPSDGYEANWHSVIERSFWAQADLFSFGMTIAVAHTEVVDGRLRLPPWWRRLALAGGLLVFLPCAWTIHQGEQSYLLQSTGEAFAIALFFSTVMIPRDDGRSGRAVRFLETRPLVWTGLVSYSLFLWHVPVIFWLAHHGFLLSGGWAALALNLLITIAVAGALSAVTYRFVELPALRRKRSTQSPAGALAPGLAAHAKVG
jgi:peptidoglycan/LPS O-acetylase OafA/YrhL